jgi:ferrous iron transport protein B
MEWYFLEVLPIFVLASVLIWVGQLTGAFAAVIAALQPAMALLGLPEEAAVVFLFGFFRRDYGAAGLYDLAQSGAIGGFQLVVAAVTLTLFVPCVAQFAVMIKERGLRTALAIVAFIFPFAFFVGYGLKTLLIALGVVL